MASFDATATILELLGGKEPKLDPVVCLEGHESEVKCCAYSSSGGLLATCSRDRSVWIWEVGLDFEYDCVGVLNGHSGDVKRVTWHPEKELLLSCSYDETIRVWAEDEDDWFCIETLTAHGHTVCDVSFDRIGEKFVSCDAGGEIIIWARGMCADGDVRYRVVTRMNVCEEGVISVHWGSDGIVAGCADDCVRVLDIVEEKLQVSASVERAHVGEVNCVRWSPVQKDVFVSTGDDGCVRIWRYESEPQEDGDRGGALQR